MSTRLNLMNELVAAYGRDISTVTDTIAINVSEVAILEKSLADARGKLAEQERRLVNMRAELAGVRAVVHTMEDAATAEARANEG